MKKATKADLKEMIVDLKMEVLSYQMPSGYCPYVTLGREKACFGKEVRLDCDSCRARCFMSLRKEIEDEVENL